MKTEQHQEITAIIPAAGRPTNKAIFNMNMPDAMMPINGKPVIGYIIEDLMKRGIGKAVIVLNKTDVSTEKYVMNKYSQRFDILVVYDRKARGLGYAMFLAIQYVETPHVLVYLGDTIYKGPLIFKRSFLVVDDKFDDSNKWCFVEKNKGAYKLVNKPQSYEGKGKVICGVYYFHDAELLNKIAIMEEKRRNFMDMHHILGPYANQDGFDLIKQRKWYDCGNIENYYQARIDFLRMRGFNSITYDNLFGILKKTGTRTEKIKDEINWYRKIPKELQILTPRLVDYKIDKKKCSYSLEYYGYQSLDDIFIFGLLDEKVWSIIIDKLLNIVSTFRTYKKDVPLSDFEIMYGKKIMDRIEELKKDVWWRSMLSRDEISINGKKYKNVPYFLPKIKDISRKFYCNKDIGLVHGDLCFNNILFDPGSRIVKLIDPRGSFGKQTLYGDIKYDLAKLRFSISGFYDFIVSDLFLVEDEGDGNLRYTCHTEDHHYKIARIFDELLKQKGFDVHKIKIIEALLFLSVIPHHYDHPARQKAMFITAIKCLNDVF